MKRLFFLWVLVGIAAVLALSGVRSQPVSAGQPQAAFESIVLDFREAPLETAQIEQRVAALAQQFGLSPALNSEFSAADHVYVVKGDRSLLDRLHRSQFAKFTEFIEPNYVYATTFAPNDPDYRQQWNLHSIRVEGAWAQTRGKGVTVAVLDTGISRVPDLAKTGFVPGYDFVNDRARADDDNGHGTHVAGTIAQSTNNGYGVAGIAYEASLMPLKVLSRQGFGTVSDIAEAIRYAADHGADVINMSLGGGGFSELMQEAIDYAYDRDVVMVAAAGNESTDAASYPAKYRHVMGVSAYDAAGEKAPYSNYGTGVDIAAPGGSTLAGSAGGILQETLDRRTGTTAFKAFQGTSMAAPHVAGVAAVIKSMGVRPPEQVAAILERSAQRVQGDRDNAFGAGRLDAAAAAQLAADRLPFWPWLWQFLRSLVWFEPQSIAWKDILLKSAIAACFTWLLQQVSRFSWRSLPLIAGLVLGAIGLFLLKGVHIAVLPHWPLRLLGSALPELGGIVWNDPRLNPIFASCLIPFGLMALLLSHPALKWLAIGTATGTAAFLTVSLLESPYVLWLGTGTPALAYLGINALLCLGIAAVSVRVAADDARRRPPTGSS
ncbi:MAG: peptidase S8 [Leptolyngbya sp. SIO4C1]|nr:peptidase S8 [Leptolyngbya sp. SIO4C1]